MAASLRHPSTQPVSEPSPDARPTLTAPAHAYLARLAALHDEAAETAYLANLLGRAPWAAAALGVVALGCAVASAQSVSMAGIVTWLALVVAGIVAIARSYGQAIAAPFERTLLKSFARDLSAILLYVGFAWGAGLFLALPAGMGMLPSIAFTAGVSVVVSAVLRARDVALCFLVPATAMGAFAALMRPEGNATTMLVILAGGAVAAGLVVLIERLSGAAVPHASVHPQHG
jgi:hypothetical protein